MREKAVSDSAEVSNIAEKLRSRGPAKPKIKSKAPKREQPSRPKQSKNAKITSNSLREEKSKPNPKTSFQPR